MNAQKRAPLDRPPDPKGTRVLHFLLDMADDFQDGPRSNIGIDLASVVSTAR
jgi:hypothetical protein